MNLHVWELGETAPGSRLTPGGYFASRLMPQPSGRSRSRPFRAPAAAQISVPAGMASGMWARGALATMGGLGRPTSCTPFFFVLSHGF
jgi:hypothetical protein